MKSLLVVACLALVGRVSGADTYKVTFSNGHEQSFDSKVAAVTYLLKTGDKAKSIVETRSVEFNPSKLSFKKAKVAKN